MGGGGVGGVVGLGWWVKPAAVPQKKTPRKGAEGNGNQPTKPNTERKQGAENFILRIFPRLKCLKIPE